MLRQYIITLVLVVCYSFCGLSYASIHGSDTPTVIVLKPNGYEQVLGGTSYTITWSQSESVINDTVLYSSDDGITWSMVYGGVACNSVYWLFPNVATPVGRIKAIVHDSNNNCSEDISDNPFTVLLNESDSMYVRTKGIYTNVHHAHCVDVRDDTAYVAADSMGLLVINVNDPSSPVLISRVPAGSAIGKVHVYGNYAFVLDGTMFKAIGGYNDSLTAFVADSLVMSHPYDFEIISGRAYVANGDKTIIIDCSDPYHLDTLGSLSGPYYNYNNTVAINDSLLFCPNSYTVYYGGGGGSFWGFAIRKYDLFDTLPTVISTFSTGGPGLGYVIVKSMAVYDSLLFVCLASSQISIMSKLGPSDRAWYNLYCEDIKLANNLAYCATGGNGINILYFKDIYNISVYGKYNTPGNAIDIFLANDLIYIADDTCGLRIYEYFGPLGINNDAQREETEYKYNKKSTMYIYGNRIFYNTTNSGNVRIDLYSILGQHINTLTNGFMNKGKHSVAVEGVANGIYFVKLKTTSVTELKKMVLVK